MFCFDCPCCLFVCACVRRYVLVVKFLHTYICVFPSLSEKHATSTIIEGRAEGVSSVR